MSRKLGKRRNEAAHGVAMEDGEELEVIRDIHLRSSEGSRTSARGIRLECVAFQRDRRFGHALGEMNAMFMKEGDMIGVSVN